jgi:hypothetical protein
MLKLTRLAALIAGASLAMLAAAQSPPPDRDYSQPDSPPPQDQAQGQEQPDADPPSRVARLSLATGQVSFVPAGENDWVEAQLNRPLVTGDKLWTDHNSRAELQIGAAALRIDQETSFDFLNLDDDTAQVELTQGTLNLNVRRLYDNQVYEVDTPTLAFVINRVGEYRVDVDANGRSTIVTAMRGGGDAYGEGGARFRVEEGQSITFNDPQLHDYVSNGLPRPDDFDNFVVSRDQRSDRSPTRQFVSEDTIGYEDLDNNGSWNDVPEYGHVWYPTTVAVGWTPYHNGHWGWVGAYGWTWIDDAPWGFAPFHYGRWAYVDNRWGWCPGPVGVRPYYAPALVAFVGGGVSIGVGGPVGWFPLGPRDVWVPGYHVSQRYFTNVNVHNTVINNVTVNNYYGNYRSGNVDYGRMNYANRNVVGATTAVPAAAFVGSRPVAASAIAVNRETFANGRVSGFAAVAPTRASLVSSNARAGIAPPAAVVNRNIVAASRPPAPVASFATRQAALQKTPGQALSVSQLRTAPVAANRPGVPAVAAHGQPNVKVVTSNGLPAVQRGAVNNGLPAVQHANGPNATQANRAVTNTTTNPNGKPTMTGPGAQTIGKPNTAQHLDSARFAPTSQAKTPTAAQGQAVRSTGEANAQIQRNNAVNNGNHTTNNPTTNVTPHANANAQTYRAPTQGATSSPRVQEYRAPTNNTATPEAHAYHPPANNVQNQQVQHVQQPQVQRVQQPQVQQQQVQHVQPQVQPRVVSPPPQHERVVTPPPSRGNEKKDDDKKHGGR